MSRKVVFLALFIFCVNQLKSQTGYGAYGNRYISVDPNLIRGDISYTQMNLKLSEIPDRAAIGIHTKAGVRMVSGFMSDENKFCVRDEFFLDLSLGLLTNDPLVYYNSPESKFSSAAMFGYEFLVGYRTDKYAALGGVKLQWSNVFIGQSWLPGDKLFTSSFPLMLRGEYSIGDAEEFRLVLMGWTNFNSEKNNSGFNLDIPFSAKRRLWFTFQYQALSYPECSPANYDNDVYTPGSFNQWFAGIKVGSIY